MTDTPHFHALKTWPKAFAEVLEGRKLAEIRKDDRGFKEGELVLLREWYPTDGRYSGRIVEARISHIARTAGPLILKGHGDAPKPTQSMRFEPMAVLSLQDVTERTDRDFELPT